MVFLKEFFEKDDFEKKNQQSSSFQISQLMKGKQVKVKPDITKMPVLLKL